MKPTSFDEKKQFRATRRFQRQKGFALVISLSLMVLLTVLAVGLLTLSTVSMRSSSQAEALETAKSNARLALMLAIGQLQKAAGPDQRISAPANLVDDKLTHGVAGVWKSWRPPNDGSGDYDAEKKNRFAGYMMSDSSFTTNIDPSTMPGSGSPTEVLVGEGSLGTNATASEVRAPRVAVGQKGTPDTGSLAWVSLDEGVKGRIDLLPDKDKATNLGKNITRLGSSARNKAGKFAGLETLAADDDTLNKTLPKLVSNDEVNLMSADKETFGKYFHDFSVTSNSVQADVANGGLKTDLSVLFDSPSLPSDYASRRVYSGTSAAFGGGTAADPLWGIYQHYYRLYQRTTANDNPRDGLKNYVGSRYRLSTIPDRTLRDNRYEPNMATMTESVIMPTISRVDVVFSLVARDPHGPWAPLATQGYTRVMHLMYLPVITLHNPYNVPLRFTQLEVEFKDLPMGFQFFVNGQACTPDLNAFNQLYTGKESGGESKLFKVTLTGDLNAPKEVLMGPGETRIFGKPFPPEWTWAQEVAANGDKFFDWQNNKTGASNKIMPGMITGPNDGVGYDLDWVAPSTTNNKRADWLTARSNSGMLPVKPDETISVKYGPKTQKSSPTNVFAVTMRLTPGNTNNNYSTTQVFFKDEARLKAILEEGTSPRFSTPRTFPETFPKPNVEAPRTAQALYEANGTQIKKYINAKPFAIFSLSGKTTKDSFTRSRPVADTGATFQMATCDFTTTASQGANPFEFVLTPVRNGSGGIESDGVKGYFFGGHGANRGSTGATFYEIPQAPLQSIAQMRHANAACLGSAPYFTYSVGESRAHPALPVNSVKFNPDSSRTMLDHSWLANDALWDRYWFSTLATLQGTAYTGSSAISQTALANEFFNGTRDLPNPRNIPYLANGKPAADAATDALIDKGAKTGVYVMTKGGFNVNSVSKSAWVSVLSALSDSSIPLASGTLEKTGSDIPSLRVRRPTGGLNEGRELKNQLWNSYRKLTPAEIDTLAEQIVVQVRQRGPFLSMSDFVNRRLSSGELAQKGALQAAIDHTKLNDIMEVNATVIAPNDLATYGWKNAAAVEGTTTGAGSPGEITQGDLLSAIGSFATVRSDTFRVRAYGDARDKDDKVLARAWCEATIQRFPEFIDAADKAETASVSLTSDANKAFGRRFSVVAFRWLHPDEV